MVTDAYGCWWLFCFMRRGGRCMGLTACRRRYVLSDILRRRKDRKGASSDDSVLNIG
jgi:hypothetical protein